MKQSGFTIVEILVVVTILALLAAIIVPAVSILSARATSAKCLGHLREIGVGLSLYVNEHDMQMPVMLAGRRSTADDGPVLDEVLLPFTGSAAVFRCPSDKSLWSQSGTSYYWNVALNGQRAGSLNFLDLVDANSRIPVVSDKEGWHRYRDTRVNFLYADGHTSTDLQLFTGD